MNSLVSWWSIDDMPQVERCEETDCSPGKLPLDKEARYGVSDDMWTALWVLQLMFECGFGVQLLSDLLHGNRNFIIWIDGRAARAI